MNIFYELCHPLIVAPQHTSYDKQRKSAKTVMLARCTEPENPAAILLSTRVWRQCFYYA